MALEISSPSLTAAYARACGLIRAADFAASLGRSVRWEQRLRDRGKGPDFVSVGSSIFYSPSAISAWVAARDSLADETEDFGEDAVAEPTNRENDALRARVADDEGNTP
jgi:hypothetical protein